jgi:predicted RND superfamily exporter protein
MKGATGRKSRASRKSSPKSASEFRFSKSSFQRIYEVSKKMEKERAVEIRQVDVTEMEAMKRYNALHRDMAQLDFVSEESAPAPDRKKEEERVRKSDEELRDLFHSVCKETSLIVQARRIGLK